MTEIRTTVKGWEILKKGAHDVYTTDEAYAKSYTKRYARFGYTMREAEWVEVSYTGKMPEWMLKGYNADPDTVDYSKETR